VRCVFRHFTWSGSASAHADANQLSAMGISADQNTGGGQVLTMNADG
jgi:hypothetical protein